MLAEDEHWLLLTLRLVILTGRLKRHQVIACLEQVLFEAGTQRLQRQLPAVRLQIGGREADVERPSRIMHFSDDGKLRRWIDLIMLINGCRWSKPVSN